MCTEGRYGLLIRFSRKQSTPSSMEGGGGLQKEFKKLSINLMRKKDKEPACIS